MNTKKTIIFILIPFLLLSCKSLNHLDNLSDKELIDKYYETDLKLYMVKRDSLEGSLAGARYAHEDVDKEARNRESSKKVNKLEKKLEFMKEELLRRGYIP